MFLCFTDRLCGCVFFSDIVPIYSAVLAANLFNKLTYFITIIIKYLALQPLDPGGRISNAYMN